MFVMRIWYGHIFIVEVFVLHSKLTILVQATVVFIEAGVGKMLKTSWTSDDFFDWDPNIVAIPELLVVDWKWFLRRLKRLFPEGVFFFLIIEVSF